jgi:hypothetical protein
MFYYLFFVWFCICSDVFYIQCLYQYGSTEKNKVMMMMMMKMELCFITGVKVKFLYVGNMYSSPVIHCMLLGENMCLQVAHHL